MIYREKPRKPKTIKMASKSKTNMAHILRGILFCSLWYLSIIAGFFILICPILPLVIISPKKYRTLSDKIFGMWEPFPVAIMEVLLGVRVVLTGDKINPFEASLFVMNHRTRVDWNFLWLGLFHCCQPNAHNIKYILKIPIMHLPGPGWVMQTCSFIFVHRDWNKDQILLDNILEYLNDSDSLYQILIFPEGTDLTEKSLRRSHKYAEEKNFQKYFKVLHPRTTGFAFIVNKMKSGGQLRAVYDMTIAYPKTMPLSEYDLLRGKFPEEVHFNVKRYSTSIIPQEEEKLKSWLMEIWKGKEEKLQKFYATGFFAGDGDQSEQSVDFGKMSMKNGVIKYGMEEQADMGYPKEAIASIKSTLSPPREEKASTSAQAVSLASSSPLAPSEGQIYAQNHLKCDEVYRSENYRPSHLLYLVLAFWITLIIFTVHQLCFNTYLQIWVLVHSLLFTALSFVSNGFHHVTAYLYFYKYGRKTSGLKKRE